MAGKLEAYTDEGDLLMLEGVTGWMALSTYNEELHVLAPREIIQNVGHGVDGRQGKPDGPVSACRQDAIEAQAEGNRVSGLGKRHRLTGDALGLTVQHHGAATLSETVEGAALATTGLAVLNDIILRVVSREGMALIDLRLACRSSRLHEPDRAFGARR